MTIPSGDALGTTRERQVVLLFFHGCPHVEEARRNVRAALTSAGVGEQWVEWDLEAPTTPDRFKGFGSPTVLVDGVDVQGGTPATHGTACRMGGAPTTSEVLAALRDP